MSQATTVKEVLVATRWILDNVGWTQGSSAYLQNNKYISFCTLGALGIVDASEDLQERAYELLMSQVDGFVSVWNDAEGRTKEQVLTVLDRAIEAANEEQP